MVRQLISVAVRPDRRHVRNPRMFTAGQCSDGVACAGCVLLAFLLDDEPGASGLF